MKMSHPPNCECMSCQAAVEFEYFTGQGVNHRNSSKIEKSCPCPQCLKCCCHLIPDFAGTEIEKNCVNSKYGICSCEWK